MAKHVLVFAETRDGELKRPSLEAIKQKYPETQKALGRMSTRTGSASPFQEFDKFFEQGWGRSRDAGSWKTVDADLKSEIDRLTAWARRVAEQQKRDARQATPASRSDGASREFGIRAHRPEAVLDAQLQLRGRGLVIEKVVPKSRAANLGLVRHDILLELNGAPIGAHSDVRPALQRGQGKDGQGNALLRAKVLRRAKVVDLELKSAR